jgi:hypothetical protein
VRCTTKLDFPEKIHAFLITDLCHSQDPFLSFGDPNMNDGRNFFLWLIFMVLIFIALGLLETFLEVPDI